MGGFGTLRRIILHGHTEWVERPEMILIHALQLKLQPFEFFPYVCIGSHAYAMFSAHALCEKWRYTHI